MSNIQPPKTPGINQAPGTSDATRSGERIHPLPEHSDASLVFIGHIETPFKTRADCPRQGNHDGPALPPDPRGTLR